MKRIISIYLCLVLFACVPAARREEAVRPTATTPDGSAATAIPTESPAAIADVLAEPDRFPVTEASIALPTTVEPVNLEDHLLVYESDGATYLYAYGESILLHQGGIYARAPYNYLTEGTALTFIEPGDGTLRIIDLDDPHKAPVTVDPDAVNGVERFAASQGGNEFLFLKNEGGEVGGKPLEAMYLYKNGEAKRIEESVGSVDQFSLSPDGNALVFYMDDPLGDYCMMDGGEPEKISSWIEDVSEDLQTVLAVEGKTLTLHRKGAEPLLLSENYKEYWPGLIKPDGTIRWIEQDHTYWQFDGAEKKKLLENVESPNTTESGMCAFFRDGSLYVQFGDDEPLLVCAKGADTRVFLSNTLEGGKQIVYGTVSDAQGAGAYMHRATYAVTVDRSGVSEPTLISDDKVRIGLYLSPDGTRLACPNQRGEIDVVTLKDMRQGDGDPRFHPQNHVPVAPHAGGRYVPVLGRRRAVLLRWRILPSFPGRRGRLHVCAIPEGCPERATDPRLTQNAPDNVIKQAAVCRMGKLFPTAPAFSCM